MQTGIAQPVKIQLCAGFILALTFLSSAVFAHHVTSASGIEVDQIDGLGSLSFPTSTQSVQAQSEFEKGMLLMHLFEYPRAEQAFQEAERIDPGFVMAYWGEAMTATHPVWNQQNSDNGRAALAKLAETPQARAEKASNVLERDWLAAVEILYGEGSKPERDKRYALAMQKMFEDYPENDEVKLFYALALLGIAQGERDLPNFLRAAEIAQQVYRHNPDHPGAAHYWIHGMDDPEHAAGALEAARALSKIAPDAGHAQHMTAHIFMALGMWQDVVTANESADAVIASQLLAKQQPNFVCGHYAEWLQYGYYQQGRQHAAQQMLIDCKQQSAVVLVWMRAHPGEQLLGYKTPEKFKQRIDSSLVTMRATAIIESAKYRSEALALDLDLSDVGRDSGWAQFSRGFAFAQSGDEAQARKILGALQTTQKLAAGEGEDASTSAYLGIMSQMLEGIVMQKSGDIGKGLSLVASAAADYEAIPFDFGPPVPVKPPRELLGEMLLVAGRPQEALIEFDKALKMAPRRALSQLGRARALAAMGDADSAMKAYQKLLEIWQKADVNLPELVEAVAGAK